MSLTVTNTHALEWVDYDGTMNAVMVNEGVEDRLSVVKMNSILSRILCHSVAGNFDKDITDRILVDTYNWQELAESEKAICQIAHV